MMPPLRRLAPFLHFLPLFAACVPSAEQAPQPTVNLRVANQAPESPETVNVERLVFLDPHLGRLFTECAARAEEIVGPEGQHQPLIAAKRTHILWRTWWNSPNLALDDFGGQRHDTPIGRGEVRRIQCELFRDREAPRQIDELFFEAYWNPAGDGWGGGMQFAYPEKRRSFHGDGFDLTFMQIRGGKPEKSLPRLRLSEQLSRVPLRKVFGDTTYAGSVSLNLEERYERKASEEAIVPWFRSAETFRETALGRLERLKAKAEAEIPSGAAIRQRFHDFSGGHSGAGIQFAAFRPPPPDSLRPLAEEEAAQILAEALEQIETTRALIEEHHAEMHAALRNAFPLDDVLTAVRNE